MTCPAYLKLKDHVHSITGFFGIREVLGRDLLTAMPDGAMEGRLDQIRGLTLHIHQEITKPQIEEWLNESEEHLQTHKDNWTDWDQANLREIRRIQMHQMAVTPELQEELITIGHEGRRRHKDAMGHGSWPDIAPYLEHVINVTRDVTQAKREYFNEQDDYEIMLGAFVPGIEKSQIDTIFADHTKFVQKTLGKALAIQEKNIPPLTLKGPFKVSDQMWLNREILGLIGFDFERGGLYETGHNPVEGGTPDDTRLVIKHAQTDSFINSFKSALHEGGHGLYIQNLPKDWRDQPVGGDMGAGVQESQALLVEMIVARSRPFMRYIAPRVEGVFRKFGDPSLTAQNLQRLRLQVKRSVDRKTADELSYFLHIQLRMKLEEELLSGGLSVADLPGAWADLSEDIIGMRPTSIKEGALQDVHWFVGKFGYFPAYAIGHMIAAQLFNTIHKTLPTLDDDIEYGSWGDMVRWLTKNLYDYGRLYETQDWLVKVTGEPLNPKYLQTHLKTRYIDKAKQDR